MYGWLNLSKGSANPLGYCLIQSPTHQVSGLDPKVRVLELRGALGVPRVSNPAPGLSFPQSSGNCTASSDASGFPPQVHVGWMTRLGSSAVKVRVRVLHVGNP